MNEQATKLDFDEIKIGMKEKFSVTITELMLEGFSKLSGDYNPLHTDDKYASSTKFKKKICHGILLASFFSKLLGMKMPGKNALYFSQSLNFKLPCFIGDEITIQGEVLHKSLATRIITVRTTIHNKEGKCLVDGLAKVLVRK